MSDSPQTGATIRVRIATNRGALDAEIFASDVPQTTNNFVELIEKSYYDGLAFHRVVDDFMVQTGCPEGTGSGGPGYRIADEFTGLKHLTGTLSMANTGEPNSGGSQFFICHRPLPHLDGKHSVFGRVISGVDVLYKLETGDTITSIAVQPA
ncbi:MAG: peptidyl-prolyl cis-trans isomerase B (cyclophilin B) [Myxococcota bacterium]|jgi:peptidyl-prolyl cis-trans isomerase B (cyclophilin B)